MEITKFWFYRCGPWKRKRKEVLSRQADGDSHCERCGRWAKSYHIHHVYPIKWREDETIEVESIDELLEGPFDILCKQCHDKMEKGGDIVDVVTRLVNGMEV